MHANITTWLISDVARKSESFEQFLRDWQPNSYRHFFERAAPRVVPVLRAFGMVHSFAIRTRVDQITIFSIFADEAGAESAWSEISGRLHEVMEGTLEFLEYTCGPAEDLIQLGQIGDSGSNQEP